MAKRQTRTSVETNVNPAIVEATLNSATKSHGNDVAKTGESKVKTPATKDYSGLGMEDAKKWLDAQGAAQKSAREMYRSFGEHFREIAWGPTQGKSQLFSPAIESYFRGWENRKNEMDKGSSQQRTFAKDIANARRVMAAYIHIGKAKVYELLDAPGSVVEFLGAIPKYDGTKPQPRKAPEKKDGTEKTGNERLEDVKRTTAMLNAEGEEFNKVAPAMDAKKIGMLFKAMTPDQLVVAVHALALALKVQQDKKLQQLGNEIDRAREAEAKSHATEAKTGTA